MIRAVLLILAISLGIFAQKADAYETQMQGARGGDQLCIWSEQRPNLISPLR